MRWQIYFESVRILLISVYRKNRSIGTELPQSSFMNTEVALAT